MSVVAAAVMSAVAAAVVTDDAAAWHIKQITAIKKDFAATDETALQSLCFQTKNKYVISKAISSAHADAECLADDLSCAVTDEDLQTVSAGLFGCEVCRNALSVVQQLDPFRACAELIGSGVLISPLTARCFSDHPNRITRTDVLSADDGIICQGLFDLNRRILFGNASAAVFDADFYNIAACVFRSKGDSRIGRQLLRLVPDGAVRLAVIYGILIGRCAVNAFRLDSHAAACVAYGGSDGGKTVSRCCFVRKGNIAGLGDRFCGAALDAVDRQGRTAVKCDLVDLRIGAENRQVRHIGTFTKCQTVDVGDSTGKTQPDQGRAVTESIGIHLCQFAGHRGIAQRGTAFKDRKVENGNALRNNDAFQRAAPCESVALHLFQAFWQLNICQTFAAVKGGSTDLGKTVGKCELFELSAVGKGIVADGVDTL